MGLILTIGFGDIGRATSDLTVEEKVELGLS